MESFHVLPAPTHPWLPPHQPPHQSGAFVTTGKSTLPCFYPPVFVVYSRFSLCVVITTPIHHCSIIQNSFTDQKIPCHVIGIIQYVAFGDWLFDLVICI